MKWLLSFSVLFSSLLTANDTFVLNNMISEFAQINRPVICPSVPEEQITVKEKNKQGVPEDQFIHCKPSKSPLFKKGPNDVLKVEITLDYKKLNNRNIHNSKLTKTTGRLTYIQDGKSTSIPINIRGRGNSRFSCGVRPMKIKFLQPQVTNIFEKLGDDIKIVNPCIANNEEHQQRLLREYYTYQILDQLETTTLKTRLSQITYKNLDGTVAYKTYAFFREPETKAGKRCGLTKRDKRDALEPMYSFSTELIGSFIGNGDFSFFGSGQNVKIFSFEGKGNYYIGYDYDLTVLVGRLSSSSKFSFPYLSSPHGQQHVTQFLAKKDAMLEIIRNSLLNEFHKNDMLEILEKQFNLLKESQVRFRENSPEPLTPGSLH